MAGWTRRLLLEVSGKLLITAPLAAPLATLGCKRERAKRTDDELLDEIERASFQYFWDEASPRTGQVKDRAVAKGVDTHTVASIAATGFGLTALCIADRRGYKPIAELSARVRTTLEFLAAMPHEHGFYFHFIDIESGARKDKCELSSIDTALLIAGVLTARQHFTDPRIKELATMIYERVDWPWMLDNGPTLSMGWKPESGFLEHRWADYCELMMLYLLGYGSPTHPLSPETWHAWRRPSFTYEGLTYLSTGAPLFTHQFSHAWFDFRGRRDAYANYFDNSVAATQAHKKFCLSLRDKYPTYSEELWGITASDSAHGYVAWGGPPAMGPIDGSIVPCAAGGSLPFAFADCMKVMHTLRNRYGDKVWTKYSFVDAFNPITGWVNPDVLGIDLGITMVMAENARTGFVWQTFMANPEMRTAMQEAGFS